jgi:hypothetical protein
MAQVLKSGAALYLWLTPIVVLAGISTVHRTLGFYATLTAALLHFGVLIAALRLSPSSPPGIKAGALLLVFGSTIAWIGATTFPGGALSAVAAHRFDYLFTTGGFLLGCLVSLAGFATIRNADRENRSIWMELGYTGLLIGTVFWILHLAFRATVVVEAASLSQVPEWYPPLRLWAGAAFAIYMALAYLAPSGFAAALARSGQISRRAGQLYVALGLIGILGFVAGSLQMPLFVYVVPHALGISMLQAASVAPQPLGAAAQGGR